MDILIYKGLDQIPMEGKYNIYKNITTAISYINRNISAQSFKMNWKLGWISAIPELNDNEISFKKLGQKEYATLPSKSVGYTAQSVEQFCSEIDTNVDNLVNLDDEQVGSIIEPYIDGF